MSAPTIRRPRSRRSLEKLGWTGVVVEPQPACAAALRAARRCPVVEAACVADSGNDTVRLFLAGTKSSVDGDFISPRFRTDRLGPRPGEDPHPDSRCAFDRNRGSSQPRHRRHRNRRHGRVRLATVPADAGSARGQRKQFQQASLYEAEGLQVVSKDWFQFMVCAPRRRMGRLPFRSGTDTEEVRLEHAHPGRARARAPRSCARVATIQPTNEVRPFGRREAERKARRMTRGGRGFTRETASC